MSSSGSSIDDNKPELQLNYVGVCGLCLIEYHPRQLPLYNEVLCIAYCIIIK